MESDRSHAKGGPRARGRGRLLRRTTAGLVVLTLLAAAASYWLDLGRRLGVAAPDPRTDPAAVAPPEGLDIPRFEPAPRLAAARPFGRVDGDAVRASLARLLRGERLGGHLAVAVGSPGDRRPVFTRGPRAVIPASTVKLLTAVAALETLGPDRRFRTVVVGQGRRLTLVGGGDPLLARARSADDGGYPDRADLGTLARRTARALRADGRTAIRLRYDTSLFSGPDVSPEWEPDYVPDHVVSPITPLWVDEGRERAGFVQRSADPARAAARVFAAALAARGISVLGVPTPGTAPVDEPELAAVESAPLAQLVQHVLEVSDNEGAEVLARHVALSQGQPGSFDGAAAEILDVLDGLGVDVRGARLYDGSGLSRHNRLRPQTLLDVLRVAASPRHPELRAAVATLPVAGFSGSLASRFDTAHPAGLGSVRAKTGTLTGVHGLAGLVTASDGTVMQFVAIANRVAVPDTLFVRARLDQIAGALAACSCGGRAA